jgi:hypothetical protein
MRQEHDGHRWATSPIVCNVNTPPSRRLSGIIHTTFMWCFTSELSTEKSWIRLLCNGVICRSALCCFERRFCCTIQTLLDFLQKVENYFYKVWCSKCVILNYQCERNIYFWYHYFKLNHRKWMKNTPEKLQFLFYNSSYSKEMQIFYNETLNVQIFLFSHSLSLCSILTTKKPRKIICFLYWFLKLSAHGRVYEHIFRF